MRVLLFERLILGLSKRNVFLALANRNRTQVVLKAGS